ncbi:hypothetical protein EVA_06152 [gut metagenome]|uniref:Uncharacterized protein n=1 Tax=gut metagenome TaxID=749906 RepID=J9GEJ1_9ZZZZ
MFLRNSIFSRFRLLPLLTDSSLFNRLLHHPLKLLRRNHLHHLSPPRLIRSHLHPVSRNSLHLNRHRTLLRLQRHHIPNLISRLRRLLFRLLGLYTLLRSRFLRTLLNLSLLGLCMSLLFKFLSYTLTYLTLIIRFYLLSIHRFAYADEFCSRQHLHTVCSGIIHKNRLAAFGRIHTARISFTLKHYMPRHNPYRT